MKKEENCSALQRKPCPFLFPHPGCVHADPTQNAKLIKIKKEPGPTVKKRGDLKITSPGTENAFYRVAERTPNSVI